MYARLLFLVLGACGRLGFTEARTADGGPATDATATKENGLDATTATGCTPPGFPQPFVSACESWGWTTAIGATVTVNNEFAISPTAGMNNSFGGCIEQNVMAFGNGFLTEISEFLDPTMPTYTSLQGWGSTSGSFFIILQMEEFQFYVNDTLVSTMPFDPTLRWWRIRPDPSSGLAVLGEVSRDAQTWIAIGSMAMTVPDFVKTQVGAGYNGVAPANLGMTRFHSVNICP